MTLAPPEVMIVEDDRDTREMLERFLQLEGFQVRTAANGEEALESLHTSGNPCVILLDLMMPVMNGWQFREAQVRQPAHEKVPVIVVTAAGPQNGIPSIDANGWLSKPLDFERLLAAIGSFCTPASGV